MRKNILIVSENLKLIRLLQSDKSRNISVITNSHTSRPIVETAQNCCLIILDIPMNEEQGFHLLLEIRKVYDIPILIISSEKNTDDMVCVIRMGADDYLISPFEDSELMMRVHSLIRRYTGFNNGIESVTSTQKGDVQIDILKRFVFVREQSIVLTPKEFDILRFFAENKGTVFSKEQIYNHVWGAAYIVDDSNITAHIRRVRKKIEPNPDSPIYIKTVWGVGYKFCES